MERATLHRLTVALLPSRAGKAWLAVHAGLLAGILAVWFTAVFELGYRFTRDTVIGFGALVAYCATVSGARPGPKVLSVAFLLAAATALGIWGVGWADRPLAALAAIAALLCACTTPDAPLTVASRHAIVVLNSMLFGLQNAGGMIRFWMVFTSLVVLVIRRDVQSIAMYPPAGVLAHIAILLPGRYPVWILIARLALCAALFFAMSWLILASPPWSVVLWVQAMCCVRPRCGTADGSAQ